MELSLRGMKSFVRSLSETTAVLIGVREERKERVYGTPPRWDVLRPLDIWEGQAGAGGEEAGTFHFLPKFA